MRVIQEKTYIGPHTNMELTKLTNIMRLSVKQTAVLVSALEDYSVSRVMIGDVDEALVADDLVLQITRVTGY